MSKANCENFHFILYIFKGKLDNFYMCVSVCRQVCLIFRQRGPFLSKNTDYYTSSNNMQLCKRCECQAPIWLYDFKIHSPYSALCHAFSCSNDDEDSLVAKLCNERDQLATLLADTQSQLAEAEEALVWNIAASIICEICPIYNLSPIDLHFACSASFFNCFTRGWTPYVLARKRCGYKLYYLCTFLFLFHLCLPGWDLTWTYTTSSDEPITYAFTTSPQHPVYALYSPISCEMALSFYYLPEPLPPLFVPRFRAGSMYKRCLCYCVHTEAK